MDNLSKTGLLFGPNRFLIGISCSAGRGGSHG
jgi:hypothetical protein